VTGRGKKQIRRPTKPGAVFLPPVTWNLIFLSTEKSEAAGSRLVFREDGGFGCSNFALVSELYV
jgi:hypothetical protein